MTQTMHCTIPCNVAGNSGHGLRLIPQLLRQRLQVHLQVKRRRHEGPEHDTKKRIGYLAAFRQRDLAAFAFRLNGENPLTGKWAAFVGDLAGC